MTLKSLENTWKFQNGRSHSWLETIVILVRCSMVDFNLLMLFLGLILQVFGGSWGSTLALVYSQSHPDKVYYLGWLLIMYNGNSFPRNILYHSFGTFFPNVNKYLVAISKGYWHGAQRDLFVAEERDWLVLWGWCCCYIPWWYATHSSFCWTSV